MKALPFVLSVIALMLAVVALAVALTPAVTDVDALRSRITALERDDPPAAAPMAASRSAVSDRRWRVSAR